MSWLDLLRVVSFGVGLPLLALVLPFAISLRFRRNPHRLTQLATALMIVADVVMVTLVRVKGDALLLTAVLPTLLVALPLVYPKRGVRIAVAFLLFVWSFPLMAALFGLLYWPAAMVLIVAEVAQFQRDAAPTS